MVSRSQRSRNMSRIRSKDTQPELRVRSILHCMGYRFRLHDANLPGKPDIVLKSHRVVVFVNGCFWHQHERCRRASMPLTNTEYWGTKLKRNVLRFREVCEVLTTMGWKVVIVWECETKEDYKLRRLLAKRMRCAN
ncbi:DNA mismatch endonuclease Vsr [bacterium]|nr:DNA mismatch endonuclease Vsr [bacterium]